jgi:hypothetical protein
MLVLAAAAIPVILLGGAIGAITFLVVIVAAIMWRGQRGARSDVILRTSLLVGNAALVVTGAQLLCAATSGRGGQPCETICRFTSRHARYVCARPDNRREVPEINAAVISGSYYPFAFRTPFHPSGVVVLEALTTDGAAYLPDSAAMNGLATAVGAKRAESLMQSFRSANAKSGLVDQVRRGFASQIVLDSASAGRYLTNPSTAEVPPDVAGLTHGKQRLGVLGLSEPGIDSTGSLAVVFARIRLPLTETEPLLERASLLLLQKEESAWTIARYWELEKKDMSPQPAAKKPAA